MIKLRGHVFDFRSHNMKLSFFSRLQMVVILGFVASLSSAARPPNVLIFFIDDLRPELGCYGVDYIQTPHIDQLASQGLRFERAYCQQAICGPSRISMLAGQYPDSLGIRDLWTKLRDVQPDAISLPRYFQNRGYRTLSFGKIYHHEIDDQASWSERPPRSSQLYADPDTQADIARRTREAKAEGLTGVPLFERTRGPAFEAADVPDEAYPDGRVATLAAAALARSTDQPFFMCVGFTKPHLPFNAPQPYWDRYNRDHFTVPNHARPSDAPAISFTNWNELRAYEGIPKEGPLDDDLTRTLRHGYAASVSYADAQVGRVLAQLDAHGLRDNTIVVLWGDHGYKLGEHGLWCKHTNLELDTRVPLIVSAPGIPRGQFTTALVEIIDLFPTLAELTAGAIPAECEGRSFASLLTQPDEPFREFALSQYPRGEVTGYSLRTDRWRYTEWINRRTLEIDSRELYDHRDSQLADRNLAALPEFFDLTTKLSQKLASRQRVQTNAQPAGD
ncbi:MAG: sulfatase [Synoicihabitans sp.]